MTADSPVMLQLFIDILQLMQGSSAAPGRWKRPSQQCVAEVKRLQDWKSTCLFPGGRDGACHMMFRVSIVVQQYT